MVQNANSHFMATTVRRPVTVVWTRLDVTLYVDVSVRPAGPEPTVMKM